MTAQTASRASELLEAATPLPWPEWDSVMGVLRLDTAVFTATSGFTTKSPADVSLAVYAVNRLPLYEAAVEALEGLLPFVRVGPGPLGDDPAAEAMRKAMDALARLTEGANHRDPR